MDVQPAPVVGIDLAVRRITEAEQIADEIVAQIQSQAIDIDRVTVGIHRVGLREAMATPRLAFSLSVRDGSPEECWHLAASATEAISPGGSPSEGPGLALRERRFGPDAAVIAAREAALAQSRRTGGRAAHYRGQDSLHGPVTVGDLITRCEIDYVLDLTAGAPAATDLVLTSPHMRPRWMFGQFVLYVLPAQSTQTYQYLPFGVCPDSAENPGRTGSAAGASAAGLGLTNWGISSGHQSSYASGCARASSMT